MQSPQYERPLGVVKTGSVKPRSEQGRMLPSYGIPVTSVYGFPVITGAHLVSVWPWQSRPMMHPCSFSPQGRMKPRS